MRERLEKRRKEDLERLWWENTEKGYGPGAVSYTHLDVYKRQDYVVRLNGADASADVVSRSVAKDDSYQKFDSQIVGNAKCSGHTECDAIIMGNAKIVAVPQLEANNIMQL